MSEVGLRLLKLSVVDVGLNTRGKNTSLDVLLKLEKILSPQPNFLNLKDAYTAREYISFKGIITFVLLLVR